MERAPEERTIAEVAQGDAGGRSPAARGRVGHRKIRPAWRRRRIPLAGMTPTAVRPPVSGHTEQTDPHGASGKPGAFVVSGAGSPAAGDGTPGRTSDNRFIAVSAGRR